MMKTRVRLRCDEPDKMYTTTFAFLVGWLSAFPRRIVTRAHFRGQAAFHCCCFRVATARHEVGAY